MNAVVSEQAQAMWQDDRASQGMGMRLERAASGEARIAMTVTETMVNGLGLCHGGFIFTLADSAMAFASNQAGDKAVAQHAAISFLRPARLGETLVAEATERARAGRSGLYDVRVSTTDGALVAEFRGQTRTLRDRITQREEQ
jgi:acyl-CoA thioesterase